MNQVSSILHGRKTNFGTATIAERFFDAAIEHGENIAICNGQYTLNYRQLATRVRMLMVQLSDQGILPGQRLGILVENDQEKIELILSAMALGIAFVPVSQQLPAERAWKVIQDAHCDVLINDAGLPLSAELLSREATQTGSLKATHKVLCIEKSTLYASIDNTDTSALGHFSGKSLKPSKFPHSDSIAYCLFTSGSTGSPKCIEIAQSAILNTILATNDAHQIDQGDRTIVLTDIGFDAALIDIFCPLMVGGSILTLPSKTCKTPEEIWRFTHQHAVTILQGTPLVLAQIIEYGKIDNNQSSVRLIVSGGDVLTPAIYKQMSGLGDITIANHYGPTEVCIDATYKIITSSEDITIGRPIANAICCIVDEEFKIVSPGVIGELIVASPGLAQGYTDDPESTEKSFIVGHNITNWPESHGELPIRFYRTGDLACIQNDNVTLFGRNDRQIKIRGVRGDLNEIESIFRTIPFILDCRVLVESKPHIGDVLISYITCTSESTLDASAIRKTLEAHLPKQMVPNTIKVIPEFPVNKNGKIDESKFQAAYAYDLLSHTSTDEVYENDTEVMIAETCTELLEIRTPSRMISFQELGAHSLLLTRMANMISTRLGVKLSTHELLTHHSIALLAAHCHDKKIKFGTTTPMSTSTHNFGYGRFPLSDSQMMLWLTQQIEPDSAQYHIPLVIEFSGNLQPSRLKAALQTVWEKHPMLTTTFSEDFEENGNSNTPNIWQQYTQQDRLKICTVNFSNKNRECVETYINNTIEMPFELVNEKLVRLELLQLSNHQFTLVIVAHHLICDGWSIDVLYRDILDEYAVVTSGNATDSDSLKHNVYSYRNFVEQQVTRDSLDQEKLSFWKEQLSELQSIPFPTDYPRPPIKSTEGNVINFCFNELQSQQLKQIAKHNQTSLFQVLFSLFTITLRQYAQTNEIVVGVPSTGRSSSELEKIVGMFVNTLVIKTECSPEYSFLDVLKSTKSAVMDALAHEVHFSSLLQAINPPRDASRTPLFQIMFDYHYEDIHDKRRVNQDLWAKSSPRQTKTSKFDLSMDIYESKQIMVMLEYTTSLFSEDSMTRFLDHFRLITEKCMSDPVTPISSIPLFHEYLTHEPIVSDPSRPEIPDVISHFYTIVDQYKTHIAVEDGRNYITYQQLDEQSNVLAHRLMQRGISHEDIIAIYLPRSIEYVVTVIGILKTGAAFTPLDPAQPLDRLDVIARRSGARVMVTSQYHESRTSVDEHETFSFHTDDILFYEQHIQGIESTKRPEQVAYPDQLSFVFYTSGSTGTPKGAMIPLRGLYNQLMAKAEEFDIQPGDGVGFLSTTGFDVSIWQSLAALMKGGRTVIYPNQVAWEPDELLKHTNQHQVVVIETVPSHFNLILQYLEKETQKFHALRYIMLNGEPLQAEHCDRWFDLCPDIPIANGYGATEVSDDCSHNYVYSHTKINRNKPMPVSGTLSGYSVYVLDEMLNVVPPGAVGEIFIGGLGVGRGYFNEYIKTASQFVPDPYSGQVGSILYRTGDMASYDIEGNIFYHGRTDNQLKINGVRVELEEIELAVRALPNIEHSLTCLNLHALPRKELITFYIEPSREEGSADPLMSMSDMQSKLMEKLPVSIVPRHLIKMTSFPVKASGKIDTKALFDSVKSLKERQKLVLASNMEEFEVLKIWNDVLGVDHNNITTNFFDAGGHSMSASVIIGRIHRKFGSRISMKDFYFQPTVKYLSDAIRSKQYSSSKSELSECEVQVSGFEEFEI